MNLAKITTTVLFVIFTFGVLFFTNNSFVEQHVLPKVYIFVFFSLLFCAFLFFRNGWSVQPDRLTVSVLVFIGYILIATIVTSNRSLHILALAGFLLLFLYFKNSDIEGKHLKTIIVGLCLLQAVYGLFQYFGIVRTASVFPIVGSFDNPAGFAACLAVTFPFAFSLLRQSKYHKWFAIMSMLVIGVAVILSESRAGIVSIGVVSAIFLFSTYGEKLRKVRKYLIPATLIIGVAMFLMLLSLNRDSASGRVLIWQNTWEMIKDAPVLGHGSGAFLAKYMDYQADYFAQNPESRFAMLADNVQHPFNEYLLLTAEFGFVGLILLAIGLFFLFKSGKIGSPNMLCLIALGVFSLFSYPLRYPFVWLIVAYCLAEISRKQKPIFVLSFWKWLKIPALACLLVGIYFLAKDISFEYQWNRIAQSSLLGKTEEMMPKYEHLHRIWNGNHLFLYNYGAELNHIGEHKKSNIILHQCLQHFNDYYVQMLLADNYFQLEKWHEAAQHYHRAADMCPSRFIPLYQLHKIALRQSNYEEARKIALSILTKPIKVPSMTVSRIRFEMQRYLENEQNQPDKF
jgi:O-antigen ligase